MEIPHGSAPVGVAVVREGEIRSLFVRFPRGWERATAGSYSSAEEFVVLEGALEMDGTTWRPGEWAYVPAGALRQLTRSPDGALAFATFHGPARWSADGEDRAAVHRRLGPHGEPADGAFGRAWLLGRTDETSSWFVEPAPGDGRAPHDCEVLSLGDHGWAWVPKGASAPSLEGPWFVRFFGGFGGEAADPVGDTGS